MSVVLSRNDHLPLICESNNNGVTKPKLIKSSTEEDRRERRNEQYILGNSYTDTASEIWDLRPMQMWWALTCYVMQVHCMIWQRKRLGDVFPIVHLNESTRRKRSAISKGQQEGVQIHQPTEMVVARNAGQA